MKWSKDAPTVPGWYWKRDQSKNFRACASDNPPKSYRERTALMMEVYLKNGLIAARYASQAASTGKPLAWMSACEWAGPIALPEEAS